MVVIQRLKLHTEFIILFQKSLVFIVTIVYAALIVCRGISIVGAVLKIFPTPLWNDGVAILLQLRRAHSVGSWSCILAEVRLRIWNVVAVVVL